MLARGYSINKSLLLKDGKNSLETKVKLIADTLQVNG